MDNPPTERTTSTTPFIRDLIYQPVKRWESIKSLKPAFLDTSNYDALRQKRTRFASSQYFELRDIDERGHYVDDDNGGKGFSNGLHPLEGVIIGQALEPRQYWHNLPKWKFGVISCATSVFIVFILNLGFTLWIAKNRGFDITGRGILQEGACDEVRKANVAAHLMINLFSTVLLASSNYCMQCLSAPTRAEVDKAHSEKRWLEIGIPSVRNHRSINWRRVLVWYLLGLSSLPLHLFFNSVAFASISSNNYVVMLVNEAFANGISEWDKSGQFNEHMVGDFDTDLIDGIYSEAVSNLTGKLHSNRLSRLENLDCIDSYGSDYVSAFGNLIVVQEDLLADNSSAATLFAFDAVQGTDHISSNCQINPFGWICDDDHKASACQNPCNDNIGLVRQTSAFWTMHNRTARYCLTDRTQEHCKLQISLHLVVTVMIANFIKLILMALVAWKMTDHPLLTIGDAVASFVSKADPYTKGMCLFSWEDFALSKWMWRFEPRPFSLKSVRWFRSNSVERWVVSNLLLFFGMVLALVLLILGLFEAQGGINEGGSGSRLFQLGIGSINVQTIIYNWGVSSQGSNGLISNIIVANLAQPVLSFIYFAYNGMFTTMCANYEWAKFSWHRKGVRISGIPQGEQRSSYFLQLPYRFAIPLMFLSGVLHWLVSQSIFLVAIERYDFLGKNVPITDDSGTASQSNEHLTCGYSPVAILCVVMLSAFLLIVGLIFGQFKFPAGMPLAASSSAVISAACHVDQAREGPNIHAKALKWGVTLMNGKVGHCAFSSGEVDFPEEGTEYAGFPGGCIDSSAAEVKRRKSSLALDQE